MEVFTVRFQHLSHMLSHYVQLSSSIHATACLSSGAGSLRSIFSEPLSTCTAFLYVRSDTTMDPMCVRAADALARQCICPGSSELEMFA